MAFFASSSLAKRKGDELVSPVLGQTTAETNGGGKYKRKLDSGKKKAKDSESSTMIKKTVSVRRDCAGASSSSVAEFIIFTKKSSLKLLVIPDSVSKVYMQEERTTFKIHHPDMKKSWNVVYIRRHPAGGFCRAGWRRLAKEYPVVVGEAYKITFLKPTELLLVVFKPTDPITV